jgi:hypothetical protein
MYPTTQRRKKGPGPEAKKEKAINIAGCNIQFMPIMADRVSLMHDKRLVTRRWHVEINLEEFKSDQRVALCSHNISATAQ